MFDTLTPDEIFALRLKLSGWASQFCMVGHTLARVGLAHDEYAGHLWQRREPYVDIMHELHDLGREVAAL